MPFTSQETAKKSFSKITISLASPDMILSRSHGEVTKPETINYRSFRKKTVCFARRFSVPFAIGNAIAGSINASAIKELPATDAALK